MCNSQGLKACSILYPLAWIEGISSASGVGPYKWKEGVNERMLASGIGEGFSQPDCLVAPAPEWILEWRAPEVVLDLSL